MTPAEFVDCVMENTVNVELMSRLAPLRLDQCHLVAGCLFQTAWNRVSGNAPDWGIKDYDVFYFADDDLSWDAEDGVIRAVDALTADLGVTVEVRNRRACIFGMLSVSATAIPSFDRRGTESTAI